MTASPSTLPRVAIACSGLGHVARGIESWAQDVSAGLNRHGIPAALWGGAPGDIERMTAIRCWKRTDRSAVLAARLLRHLGGWRIGAGSAYEVEQLTFSFNLWPRIRRDFDLLHVQDPVIATVLHRLNRAGLSRPRVILANGTGEQPGQLRHFPLLQHLTPFAADGSPHALVAGQSAFTIPNFIDLSTFCPGDRVAARRRFGLDEDGLVVLCCAAIRRYHKRIDYLIEEFATFRASHPQTPATLVIAGARESDTEELAAMARSRLGGHVRLLIGAPRATMPDLYRAADLFVMTSLFEMFGIVIAEAMATGLPVICHDSPSFRYVAGPAGLHGDLSRPGGLAEALGVLAVAERRAPLAAAARPHAQANFSEPVVIGQITQMYRAVMEAGDRADG